MNQLTSYKRGLPPFISIKERDSFMKRYTVMLANDKGDLRVYEFMGNVDREKARIEIENFIKDRGFGSEWDYDFADWEK